MKIIGKRWVYGLSVLVLGLMPRGVWAQQGDNAVYLSGSTIQGSGAFVDAAAFCGSGGSVSCSGTGFDFCATLKTALSNLSTLSPPGGVVDARGVVPAPTTINTGGGSQNCNSNPFSGFSGINSVPITILLPASTINMNGGWTLPNNVRLVGEGGYTILQDQSSFTGSNFITMGSSSICPGSTPTCSGISVEHLKLQQNPNYSHSLGGIVNQYAVESSYVNDVTFQNLDGTGMLIETPHSGPYTDLNFNAGNEASAVCVDIEAQTKGLHGITCHGNSSTAASSTYAGIRVNSGNSSLEDVHIESYWDGVRIGDETSATVNNIELSNINGTYDGSTVTNVVHICGPNSSSQYGACPQYGNVGNVTVLGATDLNNTSSNSCSGSEVCSTAIQDDVTGTSIAAPPTSSASGIPVSFYALGAEIGTSSGIYSRFATTPSFYSATDGTPTPSWGVGTTAVSSSCGTPGALYSNTAAGSGASSVYVCAGGSWTSIP
jgi:hypothetical protein